MSETPPPDELSDEPLPRDEPGPCPIKFLSLSDDPADKDELRRRNEALRQLLAEWMADESGYDEANWPEIEAGLKAARKGFRMTDDDE